MFSALLVCALAFAESKTIATQICLDRAGFSCNTIDGVWGRKSERALRGYLSARGIKAPAALSPDEAWDRFFSGQENLFTAVTVGEADLAALVKIPASPAEKAKLPRMGYESIKEMFAERGHLSVRALERMNPGVDWNAVRPGLKLVIPRFPSIEEELAAGERGRPRAPKRPSAALVKVSLGNFEITVCDAGGRLIALFPCSIARDKGKLPQQGELKITSYIPNPNYTYTPDFKPVRGKAAKYIFPEGPNCPVGVAWMGLNLPGYGVHGTPRPETIGNAESHGCFRLSNWNAARLYAMCRPSVKVVIEP
ncbi:MAG: L,D-transpeptidase [Kiritimatiellae bacterium]|nr:L,D-transpeptidase [Kiritimatiellia bacterium]